jgi:hypothetical protein
MLNHKYLFIVVISFLFACSTSKTTNTSIDTDRYEIEAVGTGVQGTYLLKVWSYASNADDAQSLAARNAVHGVIYRGFSNNERVPGQRPLVVSSDLNDQQRSFIESFVFNGFDYLQFVNQTNEGLLDIGDSIRIGSGKYAVYKVGVTVNVNVSMLRKYLEDHDIIKPLGAGF